MKKMKSNTTVHVNVIARALKQQVGINQLTRMFNDFRAKNGLTIQDKLPVKVSTVNRYTGGGQLYEVSAPTLFRRFCLSRIAKKF